MKNMIYMCIYLSSKCSTLIRHVSNNQCVLMCQLPLNLHMANNTSDTRDHIDSQLQLYVQYLLVSFWLNIHL